MVAFSYAIETVTYKNALYLKISIADKELTAEKILSYAQKSSERQVLEQLIREQMHFCQQILKSKSTGFSSFHVRAERSLELLKALGALGRLSWQGNKIVVDPFSAIEIVIEGEKQLDSVCLTGKWRCGKQSGLLSQCDLLFPADSGWIIKNGILYPIAHASSRSWTELVFPSSTTFKGNQALQFFKALQEGAFVDLPAVIWKTENPLDTLAIDPLPFLILKDRHGAFADLWFDYGVHGKVAMHDPLIPRWRNQQSEKGWEKDLLETDFIQKIIDSSHYYCPLDKVSKSLTFILDMGWKIFDHSNRRILRQKKEQIESALVDEHILIRAKIHYEEHSVDLKDLVGAFMRKDKFIDLSPHAVGLLDTQTEWQNLAEYEVVADAIAIKRHQVGLLAPLFAVQEDGGVVDYLARLGSLVQGWSVGKGTVSADFQGKLFDYQQEGLKWLAFLQESKCGGLLADEMGLGKTVQVVAFFSQLQIEQPCLIVVPTSLLFNWKREFERFLPHCPIHVHAAKTRLKADSCQIDKPHILLTTYATLRQDAQWLKTIDYQIVILDEAQTIKNPDSQIAQIAFSLRAQMRLALTGTPIENRLQDLWSLFHFLLPGLLGERSAFHAAMQAAGADTRYLQQVKRKVRPFLLRRKKQDVLLQLPPKMEQLVWVDMTQEQRACYEHWLQHTKSGLIKKIAQDGSVAHRMEILEAILRLRQLCLHPWLVEKPKQEEFFTSSAKCERLFLDLQEVIEEGKKVIVYSQFTAMLHLISQEVVNRGWNHVYLDGATKDRESVVRAFQEDPKVSLFLLSLKAGGVGLNLTAADYVFLFDPWWNDAVEQQAIDRAHRVGRSGTVIARRYITALSIEEKILHLKEHKLHLVQGLFEENAGRGDLALDDLLHLILD